MGILETLASVFGDTWDDVKLWVFYYSWLFLPVVIGLVAMTIVVLKVLPRQRRREDLSGEDHRVR